MTTPVTTSLKERRPLRAGFRTFFTGPDLCRGAVAFVVLLSASVWTAWVSAGETAAANVTHEYFVRQSAGQPLVIRVNPFEAEFTVRVSGVNEPLSKRSGLPGNRMLPLFIHVEGGDRERQLDIVIEAAWSTRATRFDLEYYRLDVRDDLSERLSAAYRQLSRGQEVLDEETAANWSVRLNQLLQSARLFAEFGMEEHRLWALLSAAHLAHFELGESALALDWLAETEAGARLSGLESPLLAARVLEGEILFQQAGGPDAGADMQEAAQVALATSGELAARAGLAYEQARAFFLRGEALARAGRHRAALEEYGRALDRTVERGAEGLAAEVRKRMVSAHEALGDVVSEEQVLDRMVRQLEVGGAQDELVQGLLAQGRLYIDLFRFEDAAFALQRALELEQSSLTRTQATILLGRAMFESGRFDEAQAILSTALTNSQTGLFRRPNPLLPLAEGLGALAGAYRALGLHDDMRRVRNVQERHLESAAERAAWALGRVLDELAASGPGAAAEVLREEAPAFRKTDSGGQGAAALLAVCAAAERPLPGCDAGSVDSAWQEASRAAAPVALAARADHAHYLVRNGRKHSSQETYRELLAWMHFLRAELPGVMGAWYWSERDRVFRAALTAFEGDSAGAALASFAAVTRVLAIGRAVGSAEQADALRSTMAQPGGAVAGALQRRFQRFEAANRRFSEDAITAWLAAMSRDEAVLVLLPEDGVARRWLARAGSIEPSLKRIPPAFVRTLAGSRDTTGSADRRLAYDTLLSDLEGKLPSVVYWLPVGQMLGADPGAFLGRGQRLAERHDFLALLDFPSAVRPRQRLPRAWPAQVFLAGDPADWSPVVAERLHISRAMAAVRDAFVGPGLHMVQGAALLPDEFGGVHLEAAGLVHLALPARLGLGGASGSMLELSESGRGSGRATLAPADIRALPVRAQLVVMGQTEYRGQPDSDYASRLGIVSDFIEAGARSVMACRENQDSETPGFFTAFYQSLSQTQEALSALRASAGADGLGPDCQLFAP